MADAGGCDRVRMVTTGVYTSGGTLARGLHLSRVNAPDTSAIDPLNLPRSTMTHTHATPRPGRPRGARSAAMVLLTALSVAACDGGVGVDGPVNATLAFQATQTSVATDPASIGPAGSAARAIAMDGNNGTLILEEVYMIVSEVELDSDDCDDDDLDDSDDGDGSDDGLRCGDFEAGPRLVALPLDGSPVAAFDGMIAAGRYDELEFEVEDLEDDDDDDWQEIGELRDEILDQFPDWPRRASVYVVGTFQREGEDPVAFRTYVDAEIEVEIELNPPLVVGDDGIDDPLLVVDVRPDLWFRDGQGGFRDLTQWDYDTTGSILELEVEIEDGFGEVEFEGG